LLLDLLLPLSLPELLVLPFDFNDDDPESLLPDFLLPLSLPELLLLPLDFNDDDPESLPPLFLLLESPLPELLLLLLPSLPDVARLPEAVGAKVGPSLVGISSSSSVGSNPLVVTHSLVSVREGLVRTTGAAMFVNPPPSSQTGTEIPNELHKKRSI